MSNFLQKFIGSRPPDIPFGSKPTNVQKDVDGVKGCWGSFMALKREKPHLKVLLSIGGGAASHNFAAVAASAALRDNFGKSAKGLVTASGLDGIDSEPDSILLRFTLSVS
jgi:GH18 family chitinase